MNALHLDSPTLFDPIMLLGRPLPELLDRLARTDPAGCEGRVELYGPDLCTVAPLVTPDHRLYSTLAFGTPAPAAVGDVDLPGVELEEFLGGGGQGCVYVGRVTATGRRIAVKVLRAGPSAGRAEREAAVGAKVRHYNVLRVFRAERAGGYWVVLMELVLGRELPAGALGSAAARRCFAQLADALHELAERRIVHRDVKPANVLVRSCDASPVLVDFGLAVDLATSDRESVAASGTPFFMAPEALRDARPEPSWDAYALGVTAAVALGAKTPLDAAAWGELRTAKLDGRFEREIVCAVGSVAGPRWAEWIGALIGPQPERRLAALGEARDWTAA
jgi:hypothetical protein